MSELGFYIRRGWPLLIIAAAVTAAFYINNSITGKIDHQIRLAHTQLSELKAEIAQTQKRVGDYNESRAAIKQHADYLFVKQDPQRLIDRLETDASDFDIILSDIQIDLPEFFKDRDKTDTVIPVRFKASFVGDYFNLGKFLKKLEKRPYLEKIENMDTVLKTPDGEKLQMNISGSFRVFDEKIIEWCLNDGT
jgi:hypothetical protein